MPKRISPNQFYGNAMSVRPSKRAKNSTIKMALSVKKPIQRSKIASKVARALSRTRTRVKRRRTIKSPADGTLSHSYTQAGKKRNSSVFKALKPLTGLQTVVDQVVGTVTGSSGEQLVDATAPLGTTTQLLDRLVSGLQINGETPVSFSNNNYASQMLSSEGQKMDYMVTNSSDFPVIVTILDLAVKQDIPDSPSFTPASLWEEGVKQKQKGSATAAPAGLFREYLFSHPLQSASFNKYWRIVNSTKVEMAAGRTHRHIFNYVGGRCISKDILWQADSANTVGYWKDITTAMLILYNGVPIVNNEGTGSTSVPEIIVRYSTQVRYRAMARTPKLYNQFGTLSSISIANQRRQATEITEDEDTP